jgi:hypothetical protein
MSCVQQALTAIAVVGDQDKTLLMWVRQEILARHANQGKGSSNASACAALIAIIAASRNELRTWWRWWLESLNNRVPPHGVEHRLALRIAF